MATRKLTSAFVEKAAAEAGAERTIFWDEGRGSVAGLGLQVTATGHKSFVFQYRIRGASRRMKLTGAWLHYERERERKAAHPIIEPPATGRFTLADAKAEAEAVRGAVARGRDPFVEMKAAASRGEDTFKAIAESYMAREGKHLRTARARARTLERHVYPVLGNRPIGEIKRSDVHRLLDRVEDKSGKVMADRVLAFVGRIFNWHSIRSDHFVNPLPRGMRASNSQKRSRILTDDEIRAVWRAAEAQGGPYASLLMFLLLTGARRAEAAEMPWDEVEGGTDWVLPPERNKPMHRSKVKVDLVRPLSPAALAVIEKLPRIGKGKFVFTMDGRRPINGFAKCKIRFDQACGVTGWTLHDLRRTARTLLSRAGVSREIAEHCLGHLPPGIVGNYDVWEYHPEKKLAYEKLAALVERIVNPQANVVPLRG
jgi:integrase